MSPNLIYDLLPSSVPVCLSASSPCCFHLSIHVFLLLSPARPLLFGLCACGHQGNSSNLPTHVPVGQGAIRGQSTSLSSCHKWCWQDGEGPRLCFEGQRGRSPALCQWLLGPPDQHCKIQLWNEGPIQPHADITIVTSPRVEVHILDFIVNNCYTFTPSSDEIS